MIKKPINDESLFSYLATIPEDTKQTYILNNAFRLIGVNTTHLVNEVISNFSLGPLEALFLSKGYTAGVLLSSIVKGNDRVRLSLECGGPVGGMEIESWACGAVRGYLKNNPIIINDKNIDSISSLYGPGFLSVTRILEGSKNPFTGTIMMEYGNLSKDLALYFTKSEEIPSAFILSSYQDKNGNVLGSGGLFIQALPDSSDRDRASMEDFLLSLEDIGKSLTEKITIKYYIDKSFNNFPLEHLSSSHIGFSCPCSKKGFSSYLSSLPEKEKDEIIRGEFPLSIKCINCGSEYKYTREEIEKLFNGEKI